MKFKEIDIGKAIVEYLQDLQWEVYQEVQAFGSGGPVIDIVATQGLVVWAIECKTNLSLKLIEQAMHRLGHANYVSIAYPSRRHRNNFAHRILKIFGIGSLTVKDTANSKYGIQVVEYNKPTLARKTTGYIRKALNENQKTFASAGNAEGKRWTPFQETCRLIKSKVACNPGITLSELLGPNGIITHYTSTATARSCIGKWGQQDVIKGVEIRFDGRLIRLFPVSDKE